MVPDQEATPHQCPYGGIVPGGRVWDCGTAGGLCNRCQQDMANRRARAIVRAILQTCSHHEWSQDDIENCVISILAGEELDD